MTAVTPCPRPTKPGTYICQRRGQNPELARIREYNGDLHISISISVFKLSLLETEARFWGPIELAAAPVDPKVTVPQKRFLRSILREVSAEYFDNWIEPTYDDNPRTIKSLVKKGYLETQGGLYRFTSAGYPAACQLSFM